MTTLTRRNGTGLDLRHPKGELNRLFDEVDAILNRSLRTFGRSGLWSDAFTPLADIEETDDAFVLDVELPGIDRKDVSVEVRGRWVTISGERTERERKGIFRTKTRVTGRFHYEAVLPEDIDVDRVTATYEDGVLTLHAPKAEPARSQARKVEIH